MDKRMNPISIERFAAYLDGNLDSKDMRDVFMQIYGDDDLQQIAEQCVAVDRDTDNVSDGGMDGISLDDIEIPQIATDGSDISMFDEFYHEEGVEDMPLGQLTADDIHQKYPDTCAIKAQQIILESNDVKVSEDDLIAESVEKGWYVPGRGGTSPKDVGAVPAPGMTFKAFAPLSLSASVAFLVFDLSTTTNKYSSFIRPPIR